MMRLSSFVVRSASTSTAAAAAASRAPTVLVLSERLVLPGHESAIASILKELATAAKANAGFVSARSMVDAENSARVIVVSEWKDVASWQRWAADGARQKQIEALRPHLFGPVSHRVLAPHRGADSGPVLV